MPDKRILPEKEKTIQKTSGNDIMYAKAIEQCQTGSFKICLRRQNFLKFMADRAKARESGKSLIFRTCTAK